MIKHPQDPSLVERRQVDFKYEEVRDRLSIAQQFMFYQLRKFGYQFICLRGCLQDLRLVTIKGTEVLAIDLFGEVETLPYMQIRN